MNTATQNPSEIVVDAGLGAAGALAGHAAGQLVPKATGAEHAAHQAAQAAAKHPLLSGSASPNKPRGRLVLLRRRQQARRSLRMRQLTQL
jgi:hypothetical protein